MPGTYLVDEQGTAYNNTNPVPVKTVTSTAYITGIATTPVKTSKGFIGKVSNAANATTGIITIYDSLAASGNLVWVGTLAAGQVLALDIPCLTGITVVTVAANAIAISFS